MSLILISGCKFNCEKNPITKECINKSLNNDKNDYFIIREPDSVFIKKKGQEKLLDIQKNDSYIVFENRKENEEDGISEFLNDAEYKLKEKYKVDVLYSRPFPIDIETFHWNVFRIQKVNNQFILIINDNDKKAKEMQRLQEKINTRFNISRTIYLPQIQYSYKGCSVKGQIFIKTLNSANGLTNSDIIYILNNTDDKDISIASIVDDKNYQEKIAKNCLKDALNNKKDILGSKNIQKYLTKTGLGFYEYADLNCKLQLSTIINSKILKYTKYTQKDDFYNDLIAKNIVKNKHKNGTHIKEDKWVKTSKLHDKGYKFINILINQEDVKENTKITKDDLIKMNNNFNYVN